jgi:hypothetical protein
VTVIDVQQDRHLRDQRVVIVGNRIRAMGDAQRLALPAGASVVEAHRKYLIPPDIRFSKRHFFSAFPCENSR